VWHANRERREPRLRLAEPTGATRPPVSVTPMTAASGLPCDIGCLMG